MKPGSIQRMFIRVKKDLGHLLDESSQSVIDEATGSLNASYKQFERGSRNSWGYEIYPNRPLQFKQSRRPTQDNRVDLYCKVQWSNEDLPITQDIKIRVWGLHTDLIFREELDALKIQEALTNPSRMHKGRVISRYHFDRVNRDGSQSISSEYHPTYHLQIGGKALDEELCWHPSTFDIPRIPHQPMDFFLVCQLIAVNFFPDEYRVIRNQAEWRSQVSSTQKELLLQYYRQCLECISAGESLLDMWSD